MERVKLPREVAEAIEGVINHADENILYDVTYIKNVCEGDKFDAPKLRPIYDYIQGVGFKLYFSAIVNGYEVEQTPEDEVREKFKDFMRYAENPDAPNEEQLMFQKLAEGMRHACDLLNIKIDGVNA